MNKKYIVIKILLFMYILFIISNLGLYVYAVITPKFQVSSKNSIVYYDKDENELFSSSEYINYTKLDEISNYVKNAIVSVEDKNFYNHNGFDYLRIAKALITNFKSGEIKEGASTISQQYIKNLFLDFNKTWKRKIEEAYLTYELEVHYSKDEILEGYLNTIDFGGGNYGIKQASKYYFNKLPDELDLSEASIIVGIPKNPSYYNPITNYDASKERQKVVLQTMVKNKYITEKEYEEAYNKELSFYGKRDKKSLSSTYYYRDAVIKELDSIKSVPNSLLNVDGLKIYTNLNIEYQEILENNVNDNTGDTDMQIASVIIEPSSGKVTALIGGKNYSQSQFNRVISSKRQVGSTIKPFLYYAALENGFTPSTTFLSEPTSFNIGNEFYSPKNAGNIYANRNISLLSAITYSDNIYAMKTHFFLGLDTLGDISKRVHIKTPIVNNASSALGTTDINMLDFANGYITLANEGIHKEPYFIEKITDLEGNVLYEHKEKEEYVLNKKYVYILNNMLSNTYNYAMVNYTSPTLIGVSNILKNEKYAVKSGSTNTDYLTIGYNKNNLVMIWMGNDDNSKVKSKDSKLSKIIWAKTISSLDNSDSWYDIPSGVTSNIINPISGELADSSGVVCYYEKGSEPSFRNAILGD